MDMARKQGGGGDVDLGLLAAESGAGTSGGGAGGTGGCAACMSPLPRHGVSLPLTLAVPAGKTGTTARREQLVSRTEAPAQYIEARHAQAERKAQAIVEDALLRQGLDANKYLEG
eukprot:350715-Chlamydomonas_euryale.AAC.12